MDRSNMFLVNFTCVKVELVLRDIYFDGGEEESLFCIYLFTN